MSECLNALKTSVESNDWRETAQILQRHDQLVISGASSSRQWTKRGACWRVSARSFNGRCNEGASTSLVDASGAAARCVSAGGECDIRTRRLSSSQQLLN